MKNYCIANWKMNQSINDCKNFENYMNTNFKYNESEMVICPSYLHLSLMTELFSNSKIEIGSQNISEYENGAFTGEISPEMLADLMTTEINTTFSFNLSRKFETNFK